MTMLKKIVILALVAALLVVGGYFWMMLVVVPEALKPRLIWKSYTFQLTDEKHVFEIGRSIPRDFGIVVNAIPMQGGEVSSRVKEHEYIVGIYLDDSFTSEILFDFNSTTSRIFHVEKGKNRFVEGWRVRNRQGKLKEITLMTSGPLLLSSATLEIYKLP